jgi:hypothetical protein
LLFDRGLILRVRQTVAGGDPDDATVKLRGPGAPDAAERFLAAATGDAKYEGDQNVGRMESPSFSITTKPVSAALTSILAGEQALETVLDDTGKTLLREIKGADPAVITCLEPIRSRSWKLEPPGFSGKVTAELWDLADVSLLEISDKAPRAAAAGLAAQLIGLLADTDIRQLDSSKTRFALEHLLPQSAKAEWLWNDPDSLRVRFKKLINDKLPKGYHAPKGTELFGSQNAYEGDKNEIAYEMVIRLDEACFQKLSKKLGELKRQDKLVLGNKKPSRLFSKFNADGGPTIIFYFPASDSDLRDLNKGNQ